MSYHQAVQTLFSDQFRDSEQLSHATVVTHHDLRQIFSPTQSTSDFEMVQHILNCFSSKEFERIEHHFELRLAELWELKFRQTYPQLADFIKHKKNEGYGAWVVHFETGTCWKTLEADDFWTVAYSRTFPLLSHEMVETLRQKTVFFSGLSTGSPVVLDVVGLGLGHVIGIDPDVVNLSNVRMRIADSDVGTAKAVWLAQKLVHINPFVEFELYPRRCSTEEMTHCVQKADVICEMTDHFANKVQIRQLARQFGKTTVMGSGFGVTPSFVVEGPADPIFQRALSAADLELLMSTTADPIERTKKAIDIVGIEHIDRRAMLNFILVGILGYWSQLQTTASVVGGAVAYTIAQIVMGYDVHKERDIALQQVFLPSAMMEKDDTVILRELQQDPRCAAMFAPFTTLEDAVCVLAHQLFAITYPRT